MAHEIERKFLLRDDSWRDAVQRSERYRQGYLANTDRCSVRVRIADGQAWLNIKSATLGVRRREYEFPVPVEEAEEILEHLCMRPFIEKVRHFVEYRGHTWEIDEFEGENAGLVVAEIELEDEEAPVPLPPWIGAEVSDDRRYYNACLIEHPYTTWAREG
ncbi:MAG: CYTH domain-containing protein [Gammaproteobacteria bacterium]|nr:MAG: CYTH domain-containing protein [Gammaproteobacteria bacterium]